MRRRSSASIAANPVLIGAATILVIVVAVFLAYNANSGLPFVPAYSLKAQVPSGAQLVAGNEVRLGGARVGVVDSIRPRRLRDGRVVAELGMKLETTVQPLPTDSTILVRPRSALGLKYVELTRGTAAQGFADGATIPLRQATPAPVEFDEALSAFDEPTREASRRNLTEFGNALAGRGADLNVALENLDPLLLNLAPVMRNLSDPRTRLGGLVEGLGATASEVAPVAETQASLLRNLDTTFGGLAAVREDLQESIEEGPATLDAGIESFPRQRPFLRNAERLAAELAPGAEALRGAAPELAGALEAGTPTLRRAVELKARLEPTFVALQRFAEDPLARLGVSGLSELSRTLAPTVAQVAPAQTVCNYATNLLRNASSLLSEGDRNGTGQRFIIIATPQGPNNEGGPSSAPADGPTPDNHLHRNPYPNTAAPGQPRECEAGNETYDAGRTVLGNDPGNQGTTVDRTTRGAGR